MTAIEFLRRYRPNSLVKSSARGEYQLAEHDSFKINGESSVWHWKSRDIGGKSALKYLIYPPTIQRTQRLAEGGYTDAVDDALTRLLHTHTPLFIW